MVKKQYNYIKELKYIQILKTMEQEKNITVFDKIKSK